MNRRRIGIVAGLALLLAAVWWIAPRRTQELLSVDGASRWLEADVPARRSFIWQQAEPLADAQQDLDDEPADPSLATALADPSIDGSLVRPVLADRGDSLYFAVRRDDGTADIVRAVRDDGQWLPPEPVQSLNSTADDIGPVISQDGQRLWIYSNRPGGLGGFDIYVSDKQDDGGWSEPRNLGLGVNTPAHDQDAAVAPDGRTLYFSSNRTPAMQRPRPRDQGQRQWAATLRAAQGLQHFDLYVAEMDSQGEWSWPVPLGDANSEASEGEPFVASSGAYLYFSSNRPNDRGERANFDLYRGRIDGLSLRDIRNLGDGVNTAANEHEPATSEDGFQLVFSSDRHAAQDDPHHYDLYSSTAVEVLEQQGWDSSRLRTAISLLARNIWWIVLLMLLAALLLAIRWWRSQATASRARVPAFFLVALLLHLLIGSGSFFVYFADDIAEKIEDAFDEVLVVANLHQSHEAGQEAYEKVADLQAVETVEPAPTPPRQVTAPTNIPSPSTSAVPSLPVQVGDASAEPVQLPVEMSTTPPPAPLPRRSTPTPSLAAAEVPLQTTPPTETAPAPPLTAPTAEVAPARQATATPTAQPPAPLPPRAAAAPSLAAAPVTVKLLPEPVPTPESPTLPQRSRPTEPTETIAAAAPSTPALAAIQPVDSPAESPVPNAANVEMAAADRQLSPQAESLRLNLPTRLTAAAGPASAPERVELATGEETPSVAPAPLVRADRIAAQIDPVVAPSLAVQPVAASMPADSPAESLQAATVALARAETDAPAPTASAPESPATSPAEAPAAQPLELAKAAVSEAVAPLTEVAAPPKMLLRKSLVAAPTLALAKLDADMTQPMDGSNNAAGDAASAQNVAIARSEAQPLEIDVASSSIGGPSNPRDPRLVVGTLDRQARLTPLSFSPVASRLQRRAARAPLLNYAEDDVGLQAMLRLRGADMEVKRDLVEAFGGTDKVLQVVSVGLNWVAQHQHEDGHWSLNDFKRVCNHKDCRGHGTHVSDTAGTGLALLPFLGDGYTHQFGEFQPLVGKGIGWLVEHQKPDGDLFTGGHGNARMYSHGIATIALCEAYGMTEDPELKEPAQRAVNFIVKAQHPSGGWRYQPGQAGDMSVMGWQLMALKSAQMAGLTVPQQTLQRAKQWLHNNEGKGDNIGVFGYQGTSGRPAMTGEGMLCLEYLGAPRTDPHLQGSARYLLRNLPEQGKNTSYYWYYGTQAMYHMQGDAWRQWNDSLRDALLETQVKDGHQAGSWDPVDNWEQSGGRLYATSLRLLMLEVYYRHLPLYQVLER